MKRIKDLLNYRLPMILMGVVYAALEGPGEQVVINQPSILPDNLTFESFLSGMISLVIILAFIASFFFLLWGGIQWITSGGDEAALGAARNRIMHAVIGLVIVVAVWALFQLVEKFLGVTVFGPGGFTVPGITGPSPTPSA